MLELNLEFNPSETEFQIGALMGALERELGKAMVDIATQAKENIKDVIETEDIWNTGELYNSIDYVVEGEETLLQQAFIGTALTYAKYQEFGTVPHFVPFHIAKSLYNQAQHEWGWSTPDVKTLASLMASRPGFLWLIPPGAERPMWGVMVSGQAQPFMGPGLDMTNAYAGERLKEIITRLRETGY